ncbi:GDSL esterase/lipase At1g29670-like [Humulus lupulus]|uniref:GDSL esterase/lipase At1g29670-like n=1 Tax=Humulus lupulus TaxID=3486 RepID=UPI002B401689|nr:GDSL esterase/lipase At1g29670-like [Humulus lupulus]
MKRIWVVVIALCVASMVRNDGEIIMIRCVHAQPEPEPEPEVPCFFIFGDSLSDGGNNNNLSTLAKVNYSPYGIDYPDGPTGRFTNGRTVVDILAEYMGFNESIPTFSSANKGSEMLQGVNYASGSAGILTNTGQHLGENINFRTQLKYHRIIMSRLGENLGNKKAARRHLNKCLYWVGIGNNDYINNYFSHHHYYSSSHAYSPDDFALRLIERYRTFVMRLYDYGAKKIVLVGLGRIGCTPNSVALYQTNGSTSCVDEMNEAVQHFNVKLLTLVDQLNANFTTAKFIYINSFGMDGGDPTVAVNKIGQCVPLGKPCEKRREYVFWDSFHPTEEVNMITASRIYKAFDLSDSYPMDLKKLIHLSLGHPHPPL